MQNPPRNGPVQQRIDELTRARHEAERKAAYWEGKAQGSVSKPETDPAEAEPKENSFDSYNDYLRALARYEVRVEATRIKDEAKQEAQQQAVAQGFEEQVKAAREKHADFDAVVYNPDLRISETMREAVLQSDGGANLAYHLGQHPEEAARIATLSPTAQIMAIGRLHAVLEAKAKAPVITSNAPSPITPLRSVDGTFTKDPAKQTDAEWWATSQGKR